MELMLALAHCGKHMQAAAIAEKYRQSKSPDNELLIDLARCFAPCTAAAADDVVLRKAYSESAIAALSAAIAQGYRDAVYLECEPDFDPMRNHAEFQDLLKAGEDGSISFKQPAPVGVEPE
jgi:hypothetical protein